MIIGRETELQLLHDAAKDSVSHFIAVYGRRRVGKTFLIREAFDYRFTFQHAGISSGGLKDQLDAFQASLKDAGFETGKPIKSWMQAFEYLKDLIRQSTEKRKIIFIDELSWMDTPKSKLIPALEQFWNGWASGRIDIVLIICASATSWIMSEVIHNKGGLYHRLTGQIHLKPLSLAKCEAYVKAKQLVLNRESILQYYMIFGGIPYYWDFITKGLSMPQNIDNILFAEDAPLKDEYRHLYAAIFRHPNDYIRIVRALGRKKAGMTREEIVDETRLANSGMLTKKLEELEACGFIRKYTPYGKKKKSSVYQLIDHFTLFYYRFLENCPDDEHFWSNQINTSAINNWYGLAFERVCLMHIPQIKQKLGITGVLTNVHALYCKADADKGLFGSQIDLILVRKDQIINLCEMKYSGAEFIMTMKEDRNMARRIHDLQIIVGSGYAIHPILITTYGLADNKYSGNIQTVVTMDDLFAP